jgi:hypothetical protein
MTTSGLPVPLPVGRYSLGSYPDYTQAQAVVDHLSDVGFPVETVSIVGADLRLVERVTGRLTRGRAAMAGALSTGWLGVLLGLFLGLFAESATAPLALAVYGFLMGVAAHAATGGRRDFASTTGLAATRYEVLVTHDRAEEAERLLAQR